MHVVTSVVTWIGRLIRKSSKVFVCVYYDIIILWIKCVLMAILNRLTRDRYHRSINNNIIYFNTYFLAAMRAYMRCNMKRGIRLGVTIRRRFIWRIRYRIVSKGLFYWFINIGVRKVNLWWQIYDVWRIAVSEYRGYRGYKALVIVATETQCSYIYNNPFIIHWQMCDKKNWTKRNS